MSISIASTVCFNNKEIPKQDFINALFDLPVAIFAEHHFKFDDAFKDLTSSRLTILECDPNTSAVRYAFDRFVIASCLAYTSRHDVKEDTTTAAQVALQAARCDFEAYETSFNQNLDALSNLAYTSYTEAKDANANADTSLDTLITACKTAGSTINLATIADVALSQAYKL